MLITVVVLIVFELFLKDLRAREDVLYVKNIAIVVYFLYVTH